MWFISKAYHRVYYRTVVRFMFSHRPFQKSFRWVDSLYKRAINFIPNWRLINIPGLSMCTSLLQSIWSLRIRYWSSLDHFATPINWLYPAARSFPPLLDWWFRITLAVVWIWNSKRNDRVVGRWALGKCGVWRASRELVFIIRSDTGLCRHRMSIKLQRCQVAEMQSSYGDSPAAWVPNIAIIFITASSSLV